MNPLVLSTAFALAILASLAVKYWLATRQMRHVAAHRDAVPPAYAGLVTPEAHRKAADYSLAKLRLGIVSDAVGAAVLIGWTLLGGLAWLNHAVLGLVEPRWGTMAYQLALFGAFSAIGWLVDLPIGLYSTFVLEQRFGFNRMTAGRYVKDTLLSTALGVAIGGPLLAAVLWIMQAAGTYWWALAWAVLVAFQLLAMVVYPAFIAPLFNRFEPLADEALAARVQALMARCGFRARGFYVMDGSKRSAHSNAYFTGFGASKRVVFYDTLLARLSGDELEAVLAHELGHFAHRHILKRLVAVFAFSLAGFALLGWLANQPAFYYGLGTLPNMSAPNNAQALLLFMLALPPFLYFVSPLFASLSRRDEYQADAYARDRANATELVRALLKLYEDNATTLTPDPVFVRFYYSHPPASARIAALGVPIAALAGIVADAIVPEPAGAAA
ncbi:MAG: M48 family metallopeptidase [Burkholderiaceae bacterium]